MDDPETDAAGIFNAFTDGSTWNGWLVPYFTADEGRRVAAWTGLAARNSSEPDVQDTVRWDPEGKVFVPESHAFPGEPEREVVEGVHVPAVGQTLYGIGGYRWTWEIVDADSN